VARRKSKSLAEDPLIIFSFGVVLLCAFLPIPWNILFILVLLGFARLYVYQYKYKQRQLLKSGIAEIDQMNGVEFEAYLQNLFSQQGYRADLTAASGDCGVDLILDKDGKRFGVQAKRYIQPVGLEAVQEVYAGRQHFGFDAAMVITNNQFTPAASKLAHTTKVTLWNREKLIEEILNTQKQKGLNES